MAEDGKAAGGATTSTHADNNSSTITSNSTNIGNGAATATSGHASKAPPRRSELRALNAAAWQTGGLDVDALGALDSSLKRNTAFIKRLRTSLQAADSVAALIKEVNVLNLGKYTSELVAATLEGLARCKTGTEIAGAVEVVSALHQRFPELFSVPLVSTLQTALQAPSKAQLAALAPDQKDKEEGARVLRQRGLLRIFAELELAGIVRGTGDATKKGGPSTGEATFGIFKDLLTADKELLITSVPLAIAFTKYLGTAFLPTAGTSAVPEDSPAGPTPAEAEALKPREGDDDLVPAATKDKVRRLLVAYYDALSRRAIKDHTQLLETDRKNHDAYIRSGEIFEDRAQNYEKLARSWEKLWAGVQSLSESLSVPLPTLPPLANSSVITGLGAASSNRANGEDGGIGGPGSIWADEEEKRFYTDLMDLRGEVPGALLKGSPEDAKDSAPAAVDAVAGDAPVSDEAPQQDDADPLAAAALEPDDGLAPAPAAQLTALFARLPDLSNCEAIDKAAVEFTFLNSKPARRRLVKLVVGLPRNRQDLIPYYSRLVATLSQYMPDIGSGAVALLEDEFRYFQRKKGQDLSESRSKNIRFLSELAKFGITPSHSILHVLKVCLDDFSGPNLDNLCTLLETCGRFLLRSEGTGEKMGVMLETVKRKKQVASNLDQRQITMLENAYYQCDPPDRPLAVPKERTPMQLYIRYLLYDVLSRPNLEKVVRALRMMHWEDPTVVRKLYNAFTKVWKVKFSSVYLFALLLYDLARYRSEFAIAVVDGVLENVTVGMEHNNFKHNQQRVATVKYVGELYTYRMVDAKVVLDTLWSLLTFGHADGRPTPDTTSLLDTPEDYFRIRLVCTLLDTCGVYFERGLLRKKMDNFLVFFQMYIKVKRQPLPMDIDFMVSDTFETLRPKLVLFATFEEAAMAVDDMFAKASVQITPAEAVQEAEAQAELDDDEGEGERVRPDHEHSESESERGEGADESDGESSSSSSESESSSSSEEEREEGNNEEDDFERELARMMAEVDPRRSAAPSKSAMTEALPPTLKKQQQHQQQAGVASEGGEGSVASDGLKFTLLMKKGKARGVDIPRESALGVHTLSKQQQDRAEQQQLKRLVLDYEQREDQESRKSWIDSAGKRGFRIKFEG